MNFPSPYTGTKDDKPSKFVSGLLPSSFSKIASCSEISPDSLSLTNLVVVVEMISSL